MEPLRVLLVEDSPSDAALVEAWLTRTRDDVTVERAGTLVEAVAAAGRVDCTLLDLSLPDAVGIGSVRTFCAAAPDAALVVLTGIDDEATGIEAVATGAQDYLVKDDLSGAELVRAVRYAVMRKRAEVELRALSAELAERSRELAHSNSTIFDGSPSGMVQLDASGTVQVANAAFGALVGRAPTELSGVDVGALVGSAAAPALVEAIAAVAGDGGARRVEALLVGATGATKLVVATMTRVTMDESGTPVVLMTADDVTADRSATIQAVHDQKLAELGRLAAGIAHEIRSPLQYIKANLQFVGDSVEELLGGRADDDADDLRSALVDMADGVDRVTDFVMGMNILAHRPTSELTDQDLNDAIRFPLAVARGQAPAGTQIVVESAELPAVPLRLGRVQQAILNLLVNAVHAVEDQAAARRRFSGRIELRTFAAPGAVGVSVVDNGVGMDAVTRAAAMEPFFTTKREGRGTGQGLALVREVAAEHGGSVEIVSEPEVGTTVTLLLPLGGPQG